MEKLKNKNKKLETLFFVFPEFRILFFILNRKYPFKLKLFYNFATGTEVLYNKLQNTSPFCLVSALKKGKID